MIKQLWVLGLVSMSGVAMADAAPPAVGDLKCLVGTWELKGAVQIGKEKSDITGDYSCKSTSGGWGVSCALRIKGIPGLETYEESDLWGVDPGDGRVHMFSVTNAGETHDHKGASTGSTFVGRYQGMREGKAMTEDVQFAFSGRDVISVESVVTIPGQPSEKFSVSAKRMS